MTGKYEEAAQLLRVGNDLEDSGQLSLAHAHYLRAMEAAPHSPRPWLNLGNVLERQGQYAEAVAAVHQAIALDAAYAPSHFNLGRLLQATGDAGGAEAAFRAAIAHQADFTSARIALADLLEATGRAKEAEAALREAIAVDPTHDGAIHNLALMLILREELDEAESLVTHALAVARDPAMACGAMGTIYMRSGRVRESEAWYRRQLQLNPTSANAGGELLFSLLARDDIDPQRLYEVHREIAAQVERGGALPRRAPDVARPPSRRIRIGYLSPDFRRHAVALFMLPVLAYHDRGAFEIFCYYNHHGGDAVTSRLRSIVEHWRDIARLDDSAAADVVRKDGIDILIDLAGHTAESRLSLFPYRCAPVQATWLGYLHSTGFDSADYRICDAHTDPPGQTEHLHSERLVRMPHSQWCYRPWHRPGASDEDVSARPPQAPVTFGSFNQIWKISESCLDLWLEVLAGVPGSRMRVLGVPAGTATSRLMDRFTARGIAAERMAILPRVGVDAYFSAIAATDIALDSMPYNGATTTLDTLWMGVPVVGLAGGRSASRSTVSLLVTLGLTDLVASTATDYVGINVRLAQDAVWRGRLRAGLRERLRASPLMDEAQFTRDLEARLVGMLHAV